jgi:hypothetical protein
MASSTAAARELGISSILSRVDGLRIAIASALDNDSKRPLIRFFNMAVPLQWAMEQESPWPLSPPRVEQ